MRTVLALTCAALTSLALLQPAASEAREGRRTAAVVGAVAGFAAGAAIASAARPSYYGYGYNSGYYGYAPAYTAYPYATAYPYGYGYPAPRTYTTTRVVRYRYVQPTYTYGAPVYYGW
jgi:hypothetical protein